MRYSPTFMRMCKPLYKIGTLTFKIGVVVTIIGLVLGLFGKGWIVLFIGIGCCAGGVFLYNLPTYYLARGFIQVYYKFITIKQSVDIAQNHLREPRIDSRDTISFVQDIMDGFEQEKTHHTFKSY
jgi:hypothetical protein